MGRKTFQQEKIVSAKALGRKRPVCSRTTKEARAAIAQQWRVVKRDLCKQVGARSYTAKIKIRNCTVILGAKRNH